MNSWMKKTRIGRAVAFRLPARAHSGLNSFSLREPLERGHMSRSPASSRTAHAHVAFFVIKPEVGWRVYWTMVSAGTLAVGAAKKVWRIRVPDQRVARPSDSPRTRDWSRLSPHRSFDREPGGHFTNWARDPAFIFCITWPRCAFTVISLMPSSPPTCFFNRPATYRGHPKECGAKQ
jgi:hypothetical protein